MQALCNFLSVMQNGKRKFAFHYLLYYLRKTDCMLCVKVQGLYMVIKVF